jgi:2-keto-4-pentenoate hydratase
VTDWETNPSVGRGIEKMLALRAERLAAGERHLGWKLGFGAPASLERFGLSAPLLGFITTATLHEPGSTVSCAGWEAAVAEPEVAAYFIADAVPGRAAQAIGSLGPAIELANIYPPSDDLEEMLAGDIYHRAVILGPEDMSRTGGLRSDLRARVIHDGETVADTKEFQETTGDLISILDHAASLLAAYGLQLAAGDVVITGSVVPPLHVEPGQEVVFELEPVGAVTVRV